MRSLEQAKECARKIKDKFSESECFHCIGKVQIQLHSTQLNPFSVYLVMCACLCGIYPQVQLSLGDFVAARRSLKKALLLGSQQPMDKQAVKKAFKYGERAFFFYQLIPVDSLYLVKIIFFTKIAEFMV